MYSSQQFICRISLSKIQLKLICFPNKNQQISLEMNQSVPITQKRNLLWNMIQPGDPYDIRQSLIAKVPGDKRIFMGDHLELVCLFQAAEIERLHESLREYAVKFKEVERVQLDRHSYEIQIKQLMMMNEDIKGSREEIAKLKQFIRKQGLQMDDMRKKNLLHDQTLQFKYQQALGRLQSVFNQNSNLKLQIQNLENRLQASRTSNFKELQQLRNKLESDRRHQIQRELSDLTASFRIERNQYENQIRRLKQRVDTEIGANDELRANIQSLNRSIGDYEIKIKQSMHVSSQLEEHERKLRMLSKELQRIQALLNQKSKQNNEVQTSLQRKQIQNKQLQALVRELEQQISRNTTQIRDQQKRIAEFLSVNEKVLQYEQKLALLTQEVQRLNLMLDTKNAQISGLNNRILQGENEAAVLRRQYKDLQFSLKQTELEREQLFTEINNGNNQRNAELRQLKQKISSLTLQNQTIKREQESYLNQSQSKIKYLLTEVDRLNEVLKVKLTDMKLKDSNFAQLNSRIAQYESETAQLRQKLNQSSHFQRSNELLKNQISELMRENQRMQTLNRTNTSQLMSENQSLKRKLRESESLMIKTTEMQRTLFSLKQEVQNANLGLKSRNDENSKLRMELSDVKQINLRLSEEVEGSKKILTDSVSMGNQNSELRNRVFALSQQVERLNTVLRSKLQEMRQLNERIQRANNEIENFQNREDTFKRTQSQLRLKITTYENEVSALVEEGERNRRKIQDLQSQLNSIRIQNQEKIYLLTRDIERATRELKNKENEFEGLREKYRIQIIQNNESVLRDSNHRISKLQDEIAHLNDLLRQKSEEAFRFQSQSKQKQMLVTRIRGQNSQLNNRVTELSRIRAAYEESMNQITKLTNENREMHSKITQQGSAISKGSINQQRIIALQADIRRLNNIIQDKSDEIERFRRRETQSADKLRDSNKEYQEERRSLAKLRDEYNRLMTKSQITEEELRSYKNNLQSGSKVAAQKDNEIHKWQIRYQELQARFEQQSHVVNQLQKRMGSLVTEIQRLNATLKLKVQENNRLTALYNDLVESQQANLQENQEQKLNAYVEEIERLNGVLQLKMTQINSLSIQFNSLQEAYELKVQECDNLQNKTSIMAVEIQRLNKVLKETLQKKDGTLIEEIERLNNALRLKVIESQEWQQQVNRSGEQVNKQYNELYAAHQQVLRENENYRQRIAQYDEKFQKLLKEFNRLEGIIQSLKSQNNVLKQENYNIKSKLNKYESLQEMNKRLNQEIERLNKVKSELEEEVGDLRMRYVDEAALHKRINQHLTLFVVLFAEIESLRSRVKEKEKEVEEVRRSSLAFKM